MQKARVHLDTLLEGPRDPRLKTRARIELGTPTSRILEVAREEDADLIVNGDARP